MRKYEPFMFFVNIIIVFIWLVGCSQFTPPPKPISEPSSFISNDDNNRNDKPQYFGPKKRIAVLDFDVKASGAPRDAGQGLSEMLITALHETGKFIVLERNSIFDILDEQKFGLDGLIKPGTEAEIGKLLGAQLLVKGVITEFSEVKQGGGFDVSVKGKRTVMIMFNGHVAMEIRIFDATTGVVIESHSSEGKVSKIAGEVVSYNDNRNNMLVIGGGGFQKTVLASACREAIKDAINFIDSKMKTVPWSSRIASIKGNDLYINAGQDSGLKIGDNLELYKRGKEIIDPNTSLSSGYQTTKIGYAKVLRFEEKCSIAQPITSCNVSEGDVVKFCMELPPQPKPEPNPIIEPIPIPKWRIMVIIPEEHITRRIPDPAGETEIIRKLVEAGFTVVDQNIVNRIRDSEEVKKAMEDSNAAITIGRENGADVVIIGEAFSEFSGNPAPRLISCRARVEARAVKTDSAEILFADGKHGSSADTSEDIAGKRALAQAGGFWADDFIKQVTNPDSPRPITLNTIQILLTNIQDIGQLYQFEDAINSMDGVENVMRRTFDAGTARIDIELSDKFDGFDRKLYSHKFDGFTIKILSATSGKLDIEIR